MQRKLLLFINVDFNATGQLLIEYSAFIKYLKKKWEYIEATPQLFIDFKKAYDSVRREVLYNILIEFDIPMKLVRLIKMCLNKTCSRYQIGKCLSGMFPTKNGLEQEKVLWSWLFNFALEYAIRRVQVDKDGLKLNGTHQLWFYADDINILGRSICTIEKNT